MNTELKKLPINGLQYVVQVSGEGKPILLLHGFPDSHQMWRKLTPLLVAAGYQVIAPDLRGFGDTDMPAKVRDYKLAKSADDCIKILEALDITDPVYLMGHDWGAALSWVLAIDYPDRFTKHVALSVGHITAFALAGLAQLWTSRYMVFFHFGRFAENTFIRRDFRYGRKWASFPDEMPHYIQNMSRPGRMRAGMRWYRANVIDAFIKKFGKCDVPTLAIWPDGDKFLKEKHIKKGTPKYMNAPYEYVKLEGANHWAALTKPKELAALVINYLAK